MRHFILGGECIWSFFLQLDSLFGDEIFKKNKLSSSVFSVGVFRPDRRIKDRQKVCFGQECRRRYQREFQKEWRAKNPKYFHGRYEYVKVWRERNPAYRRERHKRRRGIQNEMGLESSMKSITFTLPVEALKSGIQNEISLDLTVVVRSYGATGVDGIQNEMAFPSQVMIRDGACDGQRAIP